MEAKILIVEDEASISKVLQYEFAQAGFVDVEAASDGLEGLTMAKATNYDVIILDIMLPKLDGFSVCRELRAASVCSHVIMLSAKDDEFDRVLGLDSGADDYMVKPFSAKELLSKTKAILRRRDFKLNPLSQAVAGKTLKYKNLTINLDKFEVHADDCRIDFTLKEYEILVFLVKNNGRVLSREVMLDKVWDVSYYGESRVVDVHVFKVRDKLKPYGINIKTVRGVGYMLEDDSL